MTSIKKTSYTAFQAASAQLLNKDKISGPIKVIILGLSRPKRHSTAHERCIAGPAATNYIKTNNNKNDCPFWILA